MITAPVTQPTAPAELVVFSEVVTVVVPVKSWKPGMVCRVNRMDRPLTFSVITEGPVVSSAERSEDIGGVKLPGAEADDFGGGVMVGGTGVDDLMGDAAAKALCMLLVVLGVFGIAGVDVALCGVAWLIGEVKIDVQERELLDTECSCVLPNCCFLITNVVNDEVL